MSRLLDLLRRIGRASRASSESDDDPDLGPGGSVSIGGLSIGLGGHEPDRDHDGIPDRDDSDSADSGEPDSGDSGGDD